jgi:hypothetical protein
MSLFHVINLQVLYQGSNLPYLKLNLRFCWQSFCIWATAPMHRLVWIHAGRKHIMLVLSWRGTYECYENNVHFTKVNVIAREFFRMLSSSIGSGYIQQEFYEIKHKWYNFSFWKIHGRQKFFSCHIKHCETLIIWNDTSKAWIIDRHDDFYIICLCYPSIISKSIKDWVTSSLNP